METEKASHETEESLILPPFSDAHPQTDDLIGKLQNGNASPELAPSNHQLNGNITWSHFKPGSTNANGDMGLVNPMKRHHENGSSPDDVQGLFDQTGLFSVNGEQPQLGSNQPKKPRSDEMNINGNEDGFPELTKLPPGDLEFDSTVQNEPKLDNKRNCNVFSLSRSKMVPIHNGAMVTSASTENTAGDLLEKTLSQYYPEHVSIAPQAGQANGMVHSLPGNDMSDQATQSPNVSSGFPISSHTSATEQQAAISSKLHSSNGGYNAPAFMVNGYSGNYGEEHHQHPQQQQPYSLSGLPDLEQPHALSHGSGMGTMSQQVNSTPQTQNGAECLHSNSEGPHIFSKPSHEFGQDPYLTSQEKSTHIQAENASMYNTFGGPAESTQKRQHLHYRMQQLQENNPCSSENTHLKGSLCPTQPMLPKPGLESQMPGGSKSESQAGTTTTQTQHGHMKNDSSLSLNNEEHISQRTEGGSQMGWIDLNSSHPPPQAGAMSQMYRGTPPEPQLEQQQSGQQGQGHSLEPGSTQGFPAQGFNQSNYQQYQQQQQKCQAKDSYSASNQPLQSQPNLVSMWQQRNSKTPSVDEPQGPSKLQHMPQQHGGNVFCAQIHQEHLCKDQDIEQILSPEFLPHQAFPPHSSFKDKQAVNTLQRPSSQDAPQNPQSQETSQGPVDPQLLNHLKMEDYMRLEKQQQQMNSPTYRGAPQPGSTSHPRSNPSVRPNAQFGETLMPKSQSSQNDTFGFCNTDGASIQETYQMIKTEQQQQPQKQYAQSPCAQQQAPNHLSMPTNHGDYPQPNPALMQPQLSQQIPGQIIPKNEFQEPCSQYQRGPIPSPGLQGNSLKHAALQMHLLQRQERRGLSQCPSGVQQSQQALKTENGSRFGATSLPLLPAQGREIKQEQQTSSCDQNRERSILDTMEQQLRQYQPSPVYDRNSMVVKSPCKVKVEMAGGVTVLSTNADLGSGEHRKSYDFTPTKKIEPGLQNFLESPMKLLDTPIKNLLDTPVKTQYDFPPCHCVEQISEKDEGPYYTHLGAAPTVAGIREKMEKRSGFTGSSIRIEKVVYTGKEGKSTQGCPIAKWVIRRASVDEKLLVLVRERANHTCETACIVVVILIWEGIPTSLADSLYMELSDTLTKHGAHTNRRCALNEERTCACQGLDPEASGASFSFGCSWSMYYNGCKFARSKIPRKFKLLGDDPKEEERLEQHLQNLATIMGPKYKKMAPDAYSNQVEHEHRATDCRLGLQEGRPFSGVTACLDFCAHAHRDLHNMQGGSTVVCTLTREDNREIGKIPEDEQLHVLPLYKASSTDEFGSVEAQLEKTRTGGIQVLTSFRRQVRMLAEPAKSCRQRKLDARKASANKQASQTETFNCKVEKNPQAKLKQSTYENTTGQPTLIKGTYPGPGQMRAPLLPGQQPHPLQHQQSSYPQTAAYSRFPNAPSPFASKSGSMYPQPAGSASPYPPPLRVPSSFMNGSNQASPYPGSLAPSNLYSNFQCNGGMPVENYHPYYSGSPKHLDIYRQQRASLYPEQQYGGQQRFGVNYPPRYGEPGLQISGYNTSSLRSGSHPMGPYPPYGPNGGPDAQFLEAISRPPLAHPSLDYASVNKGNPLAGYPNPYLAQNPQMFPTGLDPLSMQNKPHMNLHEPNGISQVLPPLVGECLTTTQPTPHTFGLSNGIPGLQVKQEPDMQTPTPKENEDVWSDNEHNFLDPEIGGVAVAPSHGSILIECAKRELHATTPLKRPDRNHPTRISLVFYQHKNMNEAKHGLALWEAKMAEKAREKEEDAERHGGTEGTPSKSSKKVKREPPEPSECSEPPYKRFIQTLNERSLSCTTSTYVSTAPYAFTKVTGPYNHFL
ncbi:methylcytosine dioxygenase TET2 [Denticeps clupeoides]|uniref:Methylcytosine dioxygenase TET n=1 Tax=Denticeps clupeoides TaxID=299321 RepID=A0AAY4AU76_9TELE|nr:methylcytosine dioxygenase TET2 [Denticeps clupeoides]